MIYFILHTISTCTKIIVREIIKKIFLLILRGRLKQYNYLGGKSADWNPQRSFRP